MKSYWFPIWHSSPMREEVVSGRASGERRGRPMKIHAISGTWLELVRGDWVDCNQPDEWRRR